MLRLTGFFPTPTLNLSVGNSSLSVLIRQSQTITIAPPQCSDLSFLHLDCPLRFLMLL